MSDEEKAQLDDDPDLEEYCRVTGAGRVVTIMSCYILLGKLQKTPAEGRDEVIGRWATRVNRSPGALTKDLGWASKLREEHLRAVFDDAGIPASEWAQAIGTTHLQTIGRATGPDGFPLPSQEMAELAFECYHQHRSKNELEEELRRRGHLPPKRNGAGKVAPSRTPTTVLSLLAALAADGQGGPNDIPLPAPIRPGTFRLASTLRGLADLVDRRNRNAQYTIRTQTAQSPTG